MILEDTNQFRRAEGLGGVKPGHALEKAARYFAGYMAASDRYGHSADGATPAQRAVAHGYDYCLVSENIAYQWNNTGFATAELARDFFEGWKKSPGHRRNMLEREATDTAVAVAKSPRTQRWYAVQMFGRPRSLGADCGRRH
jgi:uncharacterized protein YkwD